jgi:tetratricopeptide (TPR) repeat protein
MPGKFWSLSLVIVWILHANAAWPEEPAYRRVLKDEDATKAAQIQKRIEDLWAVGKFAEAVPPAQELLSLRERVQGQHHWETSDAQRLVETLKRSAALPADLGRLLAETPAVAAKAKDLHRRGNYAEADALYREVMAAYVKTLGSDHPATASACNDVGNNLVSLGQRSAADQLFRQALVVQEKTLGPTHPHTAASYHNLAFNLTAQSQYAEGERWYLKAIAAKEAVRGPEHPDTALSYNALGSSLQSQAKYPEAEKLLRKALAIREKALGRDHLETAGSYNNLGHFLWEHGRYAAADPWYRKALAVYEKSLGKDHPNTLAIANNLAINLSNAGRHAEAEPRLREVLAGRLKVLGPDHLDTAHSFNDLAINLHNQGKQAEAETLFRKAVAIKEKALGPHDADTALSYRNLAGNLRDQGQLMAAEAYYRQALAVYLAIVGSDHPATAGVYDALALTLTYQGQYAAADALHRQALAVFEKTLGPQSGATATVCNNLALSLTYQEKYAEAERLYRRVQAIFDKALPKDHPDNATAANNLATNLEKQGRYGEAEPLHQKALALREQKLGPNHPDTAISASNLAINLTYRGQHEAAERLFRRTVTVFEKVRGKDHPPNFQAYVNLAVCLENQGKHEAAEPLWQRGVHLFEASRLRLAATGFDRAAAHAVRQDPHRGLAICCARTGKPQEAFQAAEAGLARGLLDDLQARTTVKQSGSDERLQKRAARLDEIHRLLLPLLIRGDLSKSDIERRDKLIRERQGLQAELAQQAAAESARLVYSLKQIQAQLPPDAALVFWLDQKPLQVKEPIDSHWACVVRSVGPPAWKHLSGSGADNSWTREDEKLAGRLREALAQRDLGWQRLAARLAAQRLQPLEPLLQADSDRHAVRRLVVVPIGWMAAVPIEALPGPYEVSYISSGTVYARLAEKHRPLAGSSLLAVGDPDFSTPEDPRPEPLTHGLLVLQVTPGSNAAKSHWRSGDVLLSYAGTKLAAKTDLHVRTEGQPVPVKLWRQGEKVSGAVEPGELGASFHPKAAPIVLRELRESDRLLASTRGPKPNPLPGTRREVRSLAALLPSEHVRLLLGSEASEQELGALADAGRLADFRLLHFATHGELDKSSAAQSALLLARDRLPDPLQRIKEGKRPYTGRLTVETVAKWRLDADLVCLSACETALGREAGGEGYLGFAQALFQAGAHSLVLSRWRVDDAATALFMVRFYENLLGKRPELKAPLGRAEALREAQTWLRDLRRSEVEALAKALTGGPLRGSKAPLNVVKRKETDSDDRRYAHPYYWSAFMLIGDPD